MAKNPKVFAVGTEVIVTMDTVCHCIPVGTVAKIEWRDNDTRAPVYRLEGHSAGV